jgi:hypothetical protein
MDESLRFFYEGHPDPEYDRIEYHDRLDGKHKPLLIVERQHFCGRCEKQFGRYLYVPPPEDEPHRCKVLTRLSVTTYQDIFYASCWCGWLGKEYISWFSAHDEQLEHLNVPYIKEDVEDV